jgi:hypothetical protein
MGVIIAWGKGEEALICIVLRKYTVVLNDGREKVESNRDVQGMHLLDVLLRRYPRLAGDTRPAKPTAVAIEAEVVFYVV